MGIEVGLRQAHADCGLHGVLTGQAQGMEACVILDLPRNPVIIAARICLADVASVDT